MVNFNEIDDLQAIVSQITSSQGVIDKLHEDMVIRWTYHSNAIEGNTLTLKETKVALEGITVAGKSIVEHLEAVNHKDAILFVEELSNSSNILTEHNIRLLHYLILKNIDGDNAGKYRNENVVISGASHTPPSFLDVPHKMSEFIRGCNDDINKIHPVEMAARVHTDFVGIHPFIDGNGRTARLLMNLVLLKAKLPIVILKNEDKLAYYETLDLAHTQHNYQPFIKLVANNLTEHLKQVISKSK